ncbi:MAG TPA: thioredoxin family protein [Bacteroidota bacterium]
MNTEGLKTGTSAPPFNNLPGTDGKKYSLSSFADKQALVIVFSCNHCPYVQAYEERMIALQRDYSAKGVQLVAINSNETVHYPEDNFEEMVKRAKSKGYNFPYLRDEDQSVADAYGATHTPEFFVFDAKRHLRYNGKMDDNYQNPSAVKTNYLRNAVDAILSGRDVAEPETYSIGCTIKWKT